jgi:hypothetical protein
MRRFVQLLFGSIAISLLGCGGAQDQSSDEEVSSISQAACSAVYPYPDADAPHPSYTTHTEDSEHVTGDYGCDYWSWETPGTRYHDFTAHVGMKAADVPTTQSACQKARVVAYEYGYDIFGYPTQLGSEELRGTWYAVDGGISYCNLEHYSGDWISSFTYFGHYKFRLDIKAYVIGNFGVLDFKHAWGGITAS